VPEFESLSGVLIPCRDGSRVLAPEWVSSISGESDLPFTDRPSGPIHNTNCRRRTESAGGPDGRSGPVSTVQGFHSASSSDYGLPPHREPYSPSVVVTEQGGGTLGSTSGQGVVLPVGTRPQLSWRTRAGDLLQWAWAHITSPLYPIPGSISYSRGRSTNHISPPTGSISHHNYLRCCARNANSSSHITNENSYTHKYLEL